MQEPIAQEKVKKIRVLFLDFDGVINSWQHDYRKHRERKRRWLRGRFLKYLQHAWVWLRKKVARTEWETDGNRLQRFLYRWMTDFMLLHLSDFCDQCPVSMSNVQHIVDNVPDLRIVISSSWRHSGMRLCKEVLRRGHVDTSIIIGQTPDIGHDKDGDEVYPKLSRSVPRGYQIQKWLNDNAPLLKFENTVVERFAIIDDDSDMAHLKKHFFQTDQRHGLQIATSDAIVRYLKTGERPGWIDEDEAGPDED